jgi:exodeoxyribonuclease VII small subunit
MAKKKPDARPDPEALTYEQAIAELEAISQRIENGEIGLEESLEEYRRGVALAKRCAQILDTAEQEIKKIKAGADASASGDAGISGISGGKTS